MTNLRGSRSVCGSRPKADITVYLSRQPETAYRFRAVVRPPLVILMDEPLSSLDAKLRNRMRAEIIGLRIDTTFICVTHDRTEAMTFSDRIVIMKDGFIRQTGIPQEVFHHPHILFTAALIGIPG
ncbi:MAG: ABC transporter ATP-binding protein [Solobacterium sp.]|nr:ABC transporter ATP-binding protein [Solobacterium sp.]